MFGPDLVVAARPGEFVIVPRVAGIVVVADARDVATPVAAVFQGFDASRTPLLQNPEAAEIAQAFLDQPASIPSLERLATAIRTWLQWHGHSFIMVYVPPQEVTSGVIRLVVHRARLDGDLQIDGARYFSEKTYRDAIPLAAGAEIDAAAVQAGVDRLNRNPHRRVAIAVEPGADTGTSKLTLRTQETKPWQVNLGYSNTGTAVTDESRVSAGWAWGDAFGRGDSLGYNLSADPGFEHSISHSTNYSTTFKSGRSFTLFGSSSTIESVLPAPLTQEGSSWQAGARLGMPLAKTTGGWERNLSLSVDFKYSDNTLEFAAIPITDNATHVAQLGATFSLTRGAGSRQFAFSASFYASPGGLTSRNDDAAFGISRAGARARYAYGRLDGRFAQRLPHGFSFSATAALQAATGALLGTEQLAGGGSAGVRGYRENTAFGDEGALVNAELHLPAFAPIKGRDQADVFGFLDGAVLGDRGPGRGTTEIAAAGLGLNYQFARAFSLRVAYGWALKDLPTVQTASGHGHLSANLSF